MVIVRRRLANERGNLRVVAKGAGIPYPTLSKISSGAVTDPRISTVEALFAYFAAHPEMPAPTDTTDLAH
jgi:predicted transcriptional regulator